MSAPTAPLTPADITALLGDGWDHDSSPMFDFYVWRKPDGARVDLFKGRLRVWADGKTVEPRNVPADSVTEVRAVLTFAGLIPGQVSVTQPREPALQIIERRAGTTEPPEWADRCRNCGEHAVTWVEFTHRPEVCSCSTETRPTMADPCREQVTSLSCLRCAPLFDPSLRAGGAQ